MQKLKRWLYAIAIAIFSALLVAFAYDIEKGIPIELSSTQSGRQEMLIAVAGALGFRGSFVIALLAASLSIYFAISQHFKE